jgi:tetratricopeptide (TPR) repeat protein/transcriptional regulator with XRE-family HTH domain
VFSQNQHFSKVLFGERLAQARTRLKLSQEALAEAVGTTARSIRRWEHNQALPQQYYLECLCKVLQTTPDGLFGEADGAQPIGPASLPLWYVPYTRNPYFIGREAILHQLHEKLLSSHRVSLTQPQVISGLGGIGKTQTALEYAYRYRQDYQAVLWVGAETNETLMSDYRILAHLFRLPEQDRSDHRFLREAVRRWFQCHTGWLLIFDNVEDLEMLHTMLPDTSQGYILITTRSQNIGTFGNQIVLQKMEPAEGVLLLLQRARLLSPDEPLEAAPSSVRTQAETLVELLDGLPLALDQAAAYMEEAACSVSEYLDRYAIYREDLLSTRGALSSHHPASVTATLSLAIQQVEQASPTAVDLLRMLAFLHADAMPEEFITEAGKALGQLLQPLCSDPLALDEAIKKLRRYSLLHRVPETKTLSTHRLLQTIVQDGMDEEERKLWMERLIQALLQIFPAYDDDDAGYTIEAQPLCQKCLPHMLVFAASLKKWEMVSLDAGELLYRAAAYLQYWGDAAQSIFLLLQALDMVTKIVGREHATIADYLSMLATSYILVKQYVQAEACYREALTIRKKVRGPNHPEVASSLRQLAGLLCREKMYIQAESLAQEALAIEEYAHGPHHYRVALTLSLLGTTAAWKGEHVQAELLLQRALNMYENTLGADHFSAAACLRNLGYLCSLQTDYVQAVAFYQKALSIYEKNLGPYHQLTALTLKNIGNNYFLCNNYLKAEKYYKKALALLEKISEMALLDIACTLIDLGQLYLIQSRLHLAQHCLQRALVVVGETHRIEQVDQEELTRCLLLIGDRLLAQGEQRDAHIYYQRARTLGDKRENYINPCSHRDSSFPNVSNL